MQWQRNLPLVELALAGKCRPRSAKDAMTIDAAIDDRGRNPTSLERSCKELPALHQNGEEPAGAFVAVVRTKKRQPRHLRERLAISSGNLPPARQPLAEAREVAQADGGREIVHVVLVADDVNVTFAITELGFRPISIDAKPPATTGVLRVGMSVQQRTPPSPQVTYLMA